MKAIYIIILSFTLLSCGNQKEATEDSSNISGSGVVSFLEGSSALTEGYRLTVNDGDEEYLLTGNLELLDEELKKDPSQFASIEFLGKTNKNPIPSTSAKNGTLEIIQAEIEIVGANDIKALTPLSGEGIVRFTEGTAYLAQGYRLKIEESDEEYLLAGDLQKLKEELGEDPHQFAVVSFNGQIDNSPILSTSAKNGILNITDIEIEAIGAE